jgi:hypothetical protein
MIASPNVPNTCLDPFPIEICVEFDGKRFVGRKELRNPPSTSMMGHIRPNI